MSSECWPGGRFCPSTGGTNQSCRFHNVSLVAVSVMTSLDDSSSLFLTLSSGDAGVVVVFGLELLG